jgi:hypothetical protein
MALDRSWGRNIWSDPRGWALSLDWRSRWLSWVGPVLAFAILAQSWTHPLREMNALEAGSFLVLVFAACIYQPWMLLRALRAVMPDTTKKA